MMCKWVVNSGPRLLYGHLGIITSMTDSGGNIVCTAQFFGKHILRYSDFFF